jgi:hypothetical protein
MDIINNFLGLIISLAFILLFVIYTIASID